MKKKKKIDEINWGFYSEVRSTQNGWWRLVMCFSGAEGRGWVCLRVKDVFRLGKG